jgi:WD40 repeat protein
MQYYRTGRFHQRVVRKIEPRRYRPVFAAVLLLGALLAAAYIVRQRLEPPVAEGVRVELVAAVDLEGGASAGPAWSPDGSVLAVASVAGDVILMRASGDVVQRLKHGAAATSLAWSPDSTHIAAASWGEMRVWRASDGRESARVVAGEIYEVKGWSGRDEVVTWNGEEYFTGWHRDTGQMIETQFVSIGQQQLVPSPDGKLATWQSGAGGAWTVFQVDDGPAEEWSLQGHSGSIQRVAWSPDSSEIAGACDDGIVVWKARTGKLDRVLWAPPAAVKSIDWNYPGSMLLVLTEDGSATVIDARSGTEIGASRADPRSGATWSRDGHHFAVVTSATQPQLLALRVVDVE